MKYLLFLFILPMGLSAQSYNRVLIDQPTNVINSVHPFESEGALINYRTAGSIFASNVMEMLDSLGQTQWRYISGLKLMIDSRAIGADAMYLGMVSPNCDVVTDRLGIERLNRNGALLDSTSFRIVADPFSAKIEPLDIGWTIVVTDSNAYVLDDLLNLMDTVPHTLGTVDFVHHIGSDSLLLKNQTGWYLYDWGISQVIGINAPSGDQYVRGNDSSFFTFSSSAQMIWRYSVPDLIARDSMDLSTLSFNPVSFDAREDQILLYDDANFAVLSADLNLKVQNTFRYPDLCIGQNMRQTINENGQIIRVLRNCADYLQLDVEAFHYNSQAADRFDSISIENIDIQGTFPDTIISTGNPSDPYEAHYLLDIKFLFKNNSSKVLTSMDFTYNHANFGFCNFGDIRVALTNLNIAPGDTFSYKLSSLHKPIVSQFAPKVFNISATICSANENIVTPERDGKSVNLSWVSLVENTLAVSDIYPNPFNSNLTIEGTLEAGTTLTLTGVDGKRRISRFVNERTPTYELETEGLTPGFYVLSIARDNMVENYKVVKE